VVASTWQALRATRAEQRAVDARDRTRIALTRQVAERLDGDLRRLETAGHVLAATVAHRTDWKERDLERWMRAMLEQDGQIFGMAVAFQPHQPIGRDDFSLYAFRGTSGIESKQLLPPSYLPIYREWDWYKKPFTEQRIVWSEPYVDVGGGNIPMVTVSTPIRREAVLVGVLTFDLSVKYFDVLRGWLKELQLGDNSYGFVLSQSAVFVSHPFPDFDFARASPGKAPVRMTEVGDASFKEIAKRIQQERSGAGTAIDPTTGSRATFLFAPVPSADWTFVAVVQ
jgi:sigma-B regulation protein RsbU (phosphoserine phosphatase)